MSRYFIPNYRMEDLQKKINRIRNKSVDVTFDVINDNVAKEYKTENGLIKSIPCSEVEVEGEYKINGWTFVGTIEHASPENIIRVADRRFDGRIPEKYRTAPRECEHCHIRRDRTDTYLVYNEDSDDFKQVGRTCLQNYTNGLNAETCSALVSFDEEIKKLDEMTEWGDFDEDPMFASLGFGTISYTTEQILPKAFKYVEDNGYKSGETGKAFMETLEENGRNMPSAGEEKVNAVEEFLRNTTPSDWSRNCLAAWTKSTFERRDAGLITSAVAAYLRYHQEQIRQQALVNDEGNTWAGQIGDKVVVTVKSTQVLYYKNSGNYYAGSYPYIKIVGDDGKIYCWGNSQFVELEEGDRLIGTIKALKEYKGEKQTELTRCKKL